MGASKRWGLFTFDHLPVVGCVGGVVEVVGVAVVVVLDEVVVAIEEMKIRRCREEKYPKKTIMGIKTNSK